MNKGNKTSSGSDKLITLGIVVAVIAVIALGVFATHSKISDNITRNKIESGEIAEPVWHAAEKAGMSIEDFLAEYSLTVTDEVNGDTPVSDLFGYMTLENYTNLANEGNEEPVNLDELIEGWGLTGKVTKDTMWKDVQPLMPVSAVLGSDQLAQYKEAYSLGDEVNDNTPYGEFEKIIEEKANEQSSATPAPSAEAAEAPAE